MKKIVIIVCAITALAFSTQQIKTVQRDQGKSTLKVSASKVLKSVNVLEFAPDNTLFVGDSYGGTVYAYKTSSAENPKKGTSYNLNNFDKQLEKLLGVESDEFIIKDLAVHPGNNEAYIALSVIDGDKYIPVIVIANQAGQVRLMDLETGYTKLKIDKAPARDFMYYDKVNAKTFTFTDIEFHKGKLYISGLSNQDFSSTLRVAEYPFTGEAAISSVEIFHAMHDQNETRAPIRTLTIVNLEGKDHVLAAYTCTPLVTIPVDALKDGAHVKGKTIGDVGYGNTPLDMLRFMGEDMQKNKFEVVLLTNKNKDANVLPVAGVAEANKGEGLVKFQGFGAFGFQGYYAPLSGISNMDEQDDYHIVGIRREIHSGDLQLVSFLKNLYMRISDFESEYETAGYQYPERQKWIKDMQDMMKQDEGYKTN